MSWANFSVNVLGLTNKQKICQNLKKKLKNYRSVLREEKQGKTVTIREKLEKLEKKPVNVLGFFGKCPGLKNKKTPWIKSL